MAGIQISQHTLKQVLNIEGQLSLVNNVAYFGDFRNYLTLTMNHEYALWNVTFKCAFPFFSCEIECLEQNSNQLFVFDESCGSIDDCSVDDDCNIINSISSIDKHTIKDINTVIDIIAQFTRKYESECDGINMVFDIGYPTHGESFIVNGEYKSAICCRGAKSCAYSSTIFSNSGNIFCTGDFSCGESENVWTGNYIEQGTILNNSNSVAIYCMGYFSCYASDLSSSDEIICGAYLSCYRAEITGAESLYCTDSACSKGIITQVKNVHIFGPQTDMTFFSNGVDMDIYFNGKNSGTDVTLTCSEGDICNIECGNNACNHTETVLTCNGKCFVKCHPDNSSNCVNIALSTSPTISPSPAPTMNPTVPPTNSPSMYPTISPTQTPSLTPTLIPTFSPTINSALTREDVAKWFNWVLWSIIVVICIIAIGGYADSQKCRKNELFQWNSIVLFGFYLIDFCSDIFLSMELFLLMMDANNEYDEFKDIFTVLFISSIVFIFVPVVTTLVQLHTEISKWLVDPILSQTEAQLWILSYARMLYAVAIISGSSFSAVTLLNSNLFQLNVFSMGLARFHQKIFRNKRFFSVVLLEVCFLLIHIQ